MPQGPAVFLYYSVISLRKAGADEFVEAAEVAGWRLCINTMLSAVGFVLAMLVGPGIGGNMPVGAAADTSGDCE